MKKGNTAILILIITVACLLRFYRWFDIPYTHDEFSAIFRTNFLSFSELINKGVVPDTLPAGVQVFLYFWTELFGYKEWVVKLPFMLCGIFSVYLFYLIAKKWYNETVALLSASFMACTQYFVMYSQIARPYISGLLFSLMMVNSLTNLVKNPERRFFTNCVYFVLSGTLCSYNHHFSLLFAAITGVAGTFYIQRKYLLKYFTCCMIIIGLYLPHLNILLKQIEMGGNQNWLGELPDDFFQNYFRYVFQFSAISYVLTIGIFMWGFIKIKRSDINIKNQVLFFGLFIFPALIGYLYSRYINNVLQFSVLIFNFPFLYLVLFGHIKPQKFAVNLILVLCVLSVNIFGLVVQRKHYSLFYKSIYSRVLTDHDKAEQLHKGVVSVIDTDHEISGYYFKALNPDTNFAWFDTFENMNKFIDFLKAKSKSSDYLYFGCLSSNNPLTVPLIQDYYPTIELQNNYFGGTTYLFSKKNGKENNMIERQDFEGYHQGDWSAIDRRKITDTACFSGKSSYIMDSTQEYSFSYSKPLKGFIKNRNNYIDISARVALPDTFKDINLVAELSANNRIHYWGASSFDLFTDNKTAKNGWVTVHHSVKLSDISFDESTILKVFIWNKGKNTFLVDDITIRLREGNPLIYGLFQKI